MTAAYRLKGLGWFGGVVIVSLGFYLVSLQVAAERKHLDQVNAKINAAERDIRALETEFDVRANLAQLERWNGDTLALVAPTAGQFVGSETALAAISFNGARPGAADVRTAQLLIPSRPTYGAAPAVVEAAPAAPPVTLVKVAAVNVATVKIAERTNADRPVAMLIPAVAIRPAGETIRKARAVAMLDKTLLSDTTLGDLLSGARAETGRLR